MCIYAMYALSLMGMNKTEALSEVAGVTLNESDLNHYKTLISSLGVPLNMHYNT